jgi:5-(hydroxymethyl)furfural/furfural oxidase
MWDGLTTVPNPDPAHPAGGVAIPYLHGRVLGGGSSVNGFNVHRGMPDDYDEWSAFGVRGWSWNEVLPVFRKVETDLDMSGPLHGDKGPITVQRVPEAQWSPFEHALADDWAARQLPKRADLNGAEQTGYFAVPLAMKNGRRMSAARSYLTDEVQRRPNLEVFGGTKAVRLVLKDRRVVGAEVTRDGQHVVLSARHTIVCGGSFASPLLLQRSGIGDGNALGKLGIDTVVHRPGVGANLQNHPSLMLSAFLRKPARVTSRRPMTVTCARYSSHHPGCAPADMFSQSLAQAPDATAANPLGRRLASIFTLVNKVYSRGEVRPTREGNPLVLGHIFSDERDLLRLVAGFEIIRDQLTTGPASRCVDQVFIPLRGGRTDDSALTVILNTFAGVALDSSRAVRERILNRTGLPIAAIPRERSALVAWVKQAGSTGYHAVGTCRMGIESDPQAVVNDAGQVFGVDGLSVTDASIFPTLMRSGTYLPTVMGAEKIAAAILANRRHLQNR